MSWCRYFLELKIGERYCKMGDLALSRSERFLGDQFLPQFRDQEETEHERSHHAPDILFSMVGHKGRLLGRLGSTITSLRFASKWRPSLGLDIQG